MVHCYSMFTIEVRDGGKTEYMVNRRPCPSTGMEANGWNQDDAEAW